MRASEEGAVVGASSASSPGRAARVVEEIRILFAIQFAEVRDEWIWVVLMASIFPFTVLLFFRFFTPGATEAEVMRIITGNMVFAMVIMGVNNMAQEVARQREKGHFSFYASLPISRINFVMAIFVRGFLTCLPSVVILGGLAQVVYGVAFHYSPAMVPVFAVSLLACTAFGSLLGFLSPSPVTANIAAQFFMMFVSFMTPVLLTPEMLPDVLRIVGYVFPTTYIAAALRIVLSEGWTSEVAKYFAILVLYVCGAFYVISWKLDWRLEA